jgi:prepilin-type N-terminal cleavage/methylation domain-containing protein
MLFLLKRVHMSNKGFSLVELMVVVVVIGILVTIAVPVYNSFTIRAEQATVEANLRIIDSSISRYYALSLSIKQGYEVTLLSLPAVQGSIEATPTALVALEPEGPNVLSKVEDLVDAGYLAVLPTGPNNVSYGITGEAPNQRATATGVIGEDILNGTTLNDLPWRQVKPAEVISEPEASEDIGEDTSSSPSHGKRIYKILLTKDNLPGTIEEIYASFVEYLVYWMEENDNELPFVSSANASLSWTAANYTGTDKTNLFQAKFWKDYYDYVNVEDFNSSNHSISDFKIFFKRDENGSATSKPAGVYMQIGSSYIIRFSDGTVIKDEHYKDYIDPTTEELKPPQAQD